MRKTLACCYTRFSTDQQNESSTIGQLKSIKKYCESHNIELIDTYIDEAQSGTNMNRVNFQRMMNDAPTAIWDTVVVYNMSRLSRSVKDTLIIKEDFKKMGKRIVSVIENQEETPEGDFFNLITYGMNELFVKQFKRDSWRGLMVNANECKALGGTPLYGYNIDKNRKYVINEDEAKVVRKIFSLIIDGYSYRQIAEYLNKRGLTRHGKPFSLAFTDLLRNEKYKGTYVWNLRESKDKVGKKTNRIHKPDNEVIRIEGGVPAIVDKDTFDNVQKILDFRKKRHIRRGPTTKYLLSGLIRCGYCGCPYSGSYSYTGRNKNFRIVYKCNSKKGKICVGKDINMMYMDNYIIDLINRVICNSQYSKCYKDNVNALIELKNSLIDEKLDELNVEKRNIKERSNSYANQLLQSDEETYIEITKLIGLLAIERSKIDSEELNLNNRKTAVSKLTIKEIQKRLSHYKSLIREKTLLKPTLREIIQKIEITNEDIMVYLDLNILLFSNDEGDKDFVIVLSEKRDNVALHYQRNKVDFTEDLLNRAFNNRLNEIHKK